MLNFMNLKILLTIFLSLTVAVSPSQARAEPGPQEYGVTNQDFMLKSSSWISNKSDIQKNIDFIRRDAISGNLLAMQLMSVAYGSGWGVIASPKESASWNIKAYNSGFPNGSLWVGMDYLFGYGVDKDFIKANELINSSSDSPFKDAVVGHMKMFGIGTVKDPLSGFILAKKAMNAGSSSGAIYTALGYLKGIGVEKNVNKSLDILVTQAGDGDTDAMFLMADMYRTGTGVAKDEPAALNLYLKCADLHNGNCESYLGGFMTHRQLGTNSPEEGIRYLLQSVEQGSVVGENNLGLAYIEALGTRKNVKEGIRLMLLAANSGYDTSQLNIGSYYKDGIGVEKDGQKAIYWLNKSAEAGNSNAMNLIGVIYNDGRIVHRDFLMAQVWFEHAVKAGSQIAERNLLQVKQNIREKNAPPSPETAQAIQNITDTLNTFNSAHGHN